jgi:general secretion pathway protein N
VPGVAAGLLTALASVANAQEPPRQATAQVPELPALDDLGDTIERPLFMRTRRPPKPPVAPVVEAAPVKVPTEESPADLTGIVNGPDLHYAILTNRATKEVHHVRKGEKIEEWSLQEIGPRYVVLRRGPGSLRLELFEEKEPGDGAKQPSADPDDQPMRPPNMRPRFVPRPQPVRRPQQVRQRSPRQPFRQPSRSRRDRDQ